MSSISSALSSASNSSAITASTYFNGMSTDAQSLNSQIARDVQMASLPIELLQNDVNDLTNQSNELQTLNTDMAAVQSAIAGIASASVNLLAANVSDPSVATATLGSNATAGTYTLTVTSLGSYSNATSVGGLVDPATQNISSSSSYTLTVGSQTFNVSPASNNLNALATAISGAGAGIQAAVVNVGTTSSPEYMLSLQSDQLGDVNMQLNDGTQDLLAASGAPGQLAQYTVNGHQVQSDSRTVTISPGLTVNLTGTTASNATATITVAPDSSNIGNALQSFVTAYNTAITELGKNRGQAGGALTGQSIVSQLTYTLQSLASYAGGTGNLSSIASLGLTFANITGQLSFNQSTFNAVASGQTTALQQFLGSATGGGFVQAATNALNSIEDPYSGVLTGDITNIQSQITNTNQQISDKQAQVTLLQQNLTQQMAAADAMIYSMQQQTSYFQQMFAAQNASNMAGLA